MSDRLKTYIKKHIIRNLICKHFGCLGDKNKTNGVCTRCGIWEWFFYRTCTTCGKVRVMKVDMSGYYICEEI